MNSIVIKALGAVTPGMVRLFFNDNKIGAASILFCEVIIPAVTQTNVNASFTHQVIVAGSLVIQSGYSIMASTENAENFAVTINGEDWLYP